MPEGGEMEHLSPGAVCLLIRNGGRRGAAVQTVGGTSLLLSCLACVPSREQVVGWSLCGTKLQSYISLPWASYGVDMAKLLGLPADF